MLGKTAVCVCLFSHSAVTGIRISDVGVSVLLCCRIMDCSELGKVI